MKRGAYMSHIFYRQEKEKRKIRGEEKNEIFKLTARLDRACRMWKQSSGELIVEVRSKVITEGMALKC